MNPTMYMSCIVPARPFMWTEYKLHKSIWTLFPGMDKSCFVYRVTKEGWIYSISTVPPTDTTGKWRVKSTEIYNPNLYTGLQIQFLTLVNATNDYTVNGKTSNHGIINDLVHGLIKSGKPRSAWPQPDEICQQATRKWLDKEGSKKGFHVDHFCVRGQHTKQFPNDRTGDLITYAGLDIWGILTVTDPEKFREVLLKGLGRGKRFGYGYLMVMGL